MAGNPLFAFGELLILTGGGLDTLTLDGTNSTLSGSEASFIQATASGANRDLILPSVAGNQAFGRYRVIYNAGASNNVVVKKPAGTTMITLAPGDAVIVKGAKINSTNDWHIALPVSSTFTGAIAAVAATFTGRVTTTDGVTSGDARIVGGVVHAKQTTTTVTNTTTETAIGSHSVPANTIKAGTTVRVRGSFKCTGNAGGHTATLRIKLGAVELLNTSALNTVANDVCEFEAIVSGRAAPGASVALASLARASYQQGGTLSSAAAVKDAATYTGQATNGALTAQATIQWSAASASDIITCDQFTVEVIG